VGGRRPLLLSSSVSDDNALLTIDLTNPEFEGEDGESVPAETLHILRTLFLSGGVCYQRLDIRNYGSTAAKLRVTHRFEGDFHDLFEVRGTPRAHRGRLQPVDVTADQAVLSYDGLDGI